MSVASLKKEQFSSLSHDNYTLVFHFNPSQRRLLQKLNIPPPASLLAAVETVDDIALCTLVNRGHILLQSLRVSFL